MSVADWLAARSAGVPDALARRIHAALGADMQADAGRASAIFLAAAERLLREILEARRFARDGALDLLAVDALATYAFEHAATTDGADLDAVTRDGTALIGQLATHG